MPLRHIQRASAAWFAFALLTAARVSAQEADGDAHDERHFHRNHVAVVVGGMTPLSETSQTSFALGADYERRLDPVWGVGVGADFTIGDHERSALFGTGVSFRPTPALRLGTVPASSCWRRMRARAGPRTRPTSSGVSRRSTSSTSGLSPSDPTSSSTSWARRRPTSRTASRWERASKESVIY